MPSGIGTQVSGREGGDEYPYLGERASVCLGRLLCKNFR